MSTLLVLIAGTFLAAASTLLRIRSARRSAAEDEYRHWVTDTQRLLRNVAHGRKPAAGPRFHAGPSIKVSPSHRAWAARGVAESEFSWARDYGFIKLPEQSDLTRSDAPQGGE